MTPRLVHRPVPRLESLEERINLSPPTVLGVQIDDGTIERSMIRSLTIRFSEVVTFSGALNNAFWLNRNTASFEQPGITGLVNLSVLQVGSVVLVRFMSSGPNP